MSDAFDADRNQEPLSCFLNLDEANQLIVSSDNYYMVMLYCWGDYDDKNSVDKYLAMQFYMN